MATDAKGKQLPKGIRQRENGRFEARVQRDGETHSVYADTLTEAKKKKNDLEYKLDHGLFVEKQRITFDAWFNTWMQDYKANTVKRGTLDSYSRCYKYYIKDFLGKRDISSIRGEHIQQLYNKLTKANYAASTIGVVSAILDGAFKQAVKNGLVERNPVDSTNLPRRPDREQRQALTKEQQDLFMEYAKGSYLYNLFAILLRTGMRIGEATGLKISDIDKKERVIHIRRTLKYYGKDGFLEDTPKTRKSIRDIPITPDIMTFLNNQRNFWGSKVENIGRYLFCDEKGKPFARDRVQREINRITGIIRNDGHDFPKITPHCFRHTFCTRAVEAGMDPQALKTIMGHSSFNETMDRYSHIQDEYKKTEMEKIANVF